MVMAANARVGEPWWWAWEWPCMGWHAATGVGRTLFQGGNEGNERWRAHGQCCFRTRRRPIHSLRTLHSPHSPHSQPLLHQRPDLLPRSEEHTSELQSLMRISYAVFCLKKK